MNETINNLINELALVSYDAGHASGGRDPEGYVAYVEEAGRLAQELRAEIREVVENA